jgi:hypothetical protein
VAKCRSKRSGPDARRAVAIVERYADQRRDEEVGGLFCSTAGLKVLPYTTMVQKNRPTTDRQPASRLPGMKIRREHRLDDP